MAAFASTVFGRVDRGAGRGEDVSSVRSKGTIKVKVKGKFKVKVKSEVKGSGQECPLHTNNSRFLHFGRNDRVSEGEASVGMTELWMGTVVELRSNGRPRAAVPT